MRRGEKGSVVLEGALVATLMLFLVFGFIDLSIQIVAASSVQNAAAAASHAMEETGSETAALEAAKNRVPAFLRSRIVLGGWTSFDEIAGSDFSVAGDGAAYVPPVPPSAKAVAFYVLCDWQYMTAPLRNLVGANAEVRAWAVALLPG